MKDILKKAQDYFKISMDEFESSRVEAKEVRGFNDNKHYTIEQLNTLRNRKQPEETFNIVKAYKRVISGYLSSVINKINIIASHPVYTIKAVVADDIVQYTLRSNYINMLRNDIQDELILSGLVGYEIFPILKGYDNLGIPDIDLKIQYLSENELAIDPLARNYDYSDARFIHTFKWVNNENLSELFPEQAEKLKKQTLQNPWINTYDTNKTAFNGVYATYHNTLIIKTQLKYKKKIYEILWSGDTLIKVRDITKIGRFTIRPFTMETTEDGEYYGLFREVIESQKAINQALIQIQLLVNTNKVLVNTSALVDNNLEHFKQMYDRVNAIIPVKDLDGIRIENLSGDVVAQYNIISASLDRIKMVLNLNDSFLGMAGSSASGRQVKLQQNMTASALQYLTIKINAIYEFLARDILDMAQLYYKANKIIRITDPITGTKYTEINKPVVINNQVQFRKIKEGDGIIRMIPWYYKETTIDDLDYEVEITTANYNETDDLEKIQLDNIIQGSSGQMLLNTNPAAYSKVVAIQMKSMKTRNSETIASIFEDIAKKLEQAPTQDPRQLPGGQQPQQTSAGAMLDALGATNDAQPDGYNLPKE